MENNETQQVYVVGLCGSLRQGSTTHAALAIALNGAETAGAVVELLDLNDYSLVFHGSTEDESKYPADVFKLKQKILQADGVLLGTPEYHGSFSGVIKNALDLMDYGTFSNKVIGLIGVSGGRMGAGSALSMLRIVCASLQAWVLPDDVSIPRSSEVFDADGNLQDSELELRLKSLGQKVAKYAAMLNSKHKRVYDKITQLG